MPTAKKVFFKEWTDGDLAPPDISAPGYVVIEKNLEQVKKLTPMVLSMLRDTFVDEYLTMIGSQQTWDDIYHQFQDEIRKAIDDELFASTTQAHINDCARQMTNRLIDHIDGNAWATETFYDAWGWSCFPGISTHLFDGIELRVQVLGVWITRDMGNEGPEIGEMIREEAWKMVQQNLDFDSLDPYNIEHTWPNDLSIREKNPPHEHTPYVVDEAIDVLDLVTVWTNSPYYNEKYFAYVYITTGDCMAGSVGGSQGKQYEPTAEVQAYRDRYIASKDLSIPYDLMAHELWDADNEYSFLSNDHIDLWWDAVDGDHNAYDTLLDTFAPLPSWIDNPFSYQLDTILYWLDHSLNGGVRYFPIYPPIPYDGWIQNLAYYEIDINNANIEYMIIQSITDAITEAVGEVDLDGQNPNDDLSMHSQYGIGVPKSSDVYDTSSHSIVNDPELWWNATKGISDSYDYLLNAFFPPSVSHGVSKLEAILQWLDESKHGWLGNVCEDQITNMNSGLITNRTVEEWLFTAEDALIQNVDPELAKVNIFDNVHDESEAVEVGTHRYTIYTGKDDPSKAKQLVKFNNEEKVSIWANPIEVKGSVDGTQFAPKISPSDSIDLFLTELMRPTKFNFDKKTSIYDINLFRFQISDETFEPEAVYYTDIEGLANMYQEYGLPVYLSKPHFLDSDHTILGSVGGMNPNPHNHDTYIYVEPLTGITMKAQARLQVNFKVSPTDIWYKDMQETYLPILWVEKEAEITEDKANEFKELYKALEFRKTIIPTLIGIGSIIAFSGFVLARSQKNKLRNDKVQRIKNKYEVKKIQNHNFKEDILLKENSLK
ncbi:MAG: hypothetical protein GF383_16065 [Candidatus Lokiarchaeota archaeon]|nr:hypothetical protein [Candidatus Lokiarchaeota archaeon]